MILLPLLLALQSDKLPPANPLPPPATEEAGVMRPIEAMFAGLAAHDGAAILAQVRPEGGATVAIENPGGTRTIRHMTWEAFASGIKPGPARIEERLTDVAIDIDGDIAMVWAPYVLLVDGKPQHCGTDHFDLVRENAQWKVLNVTWSQRTTGARWGDGAAGCWFLERSAFAQPMPFAGSVAFPENGCLTLQTAPLLMHIYRYGSQAIPSPSPSMLPR